MRRGAFVLVVLASGCTFFTGVEAEPVTCTMARAGADTVTVRLAGDTTRTLASVGWCVK